VRRADGTVEPIGRPGNLVGVDRDIDLRPAQVVLEAGATLVLFTDGVSETHRGTAFFGEEGIAATLATATGGAAETAGEIEAAAREFLGGERAKDDMVLLAVKVLPAG
jgi:serine phosphatase RsbU (regulator of sigma subunit)